MPKEYHYEWIYDLQSTPEALWPLVADTNRFNRDTGLPPVVLLGVENGVRRVKFKIPLIRIEWEEEPFEWTYPTGFGIVRRYRNGPLKEMRVDVQLKRKDKGTQLVYNVWGIARNVLGDIAISLGIGIISAKRFGDTYRLYDKIAGSSKSIMTVSQSGKISTAGRNRFKLKSEQLKSQGVDETMLNRLYEFLDRADDLSIQRMRPYTLADQWGFSRRIVLETFLRATRTGMLDMYWDILCPECSGTTEDVPRLGDLKAHSHCSSCRIDFTADFDNNVEVIFRPNSAIRQVDTKVEFCVGSPQRQPKVIMNMIVPAHEELPVTTSLEPGRYNVYASELDGQQILVAGDEGDAKLDIRAKINGWTNEIIKSSLMPRLNLINATDQAQTFELVRTAWTDQAATAADVTTLQVFRDLFSSEVLRQGEEISVSSITLMFTDLRNSTKLYREIGDAPAFGRVREHFEILEQAVAKEGGSIVKTMGDAIMAAFRNPAAAMRAIWDVQHQLTARGEPLLSIKVGIHHGPCIVVNLNDRLDYFGSTVNIAARLPHFSKGGEVIFSESLRSDMEVMEFLEKNAAPNSVEKFQSNIRGYDHTMNLWRVRMK
jgi:class 3 adenylate cyclase